MITNSTAIVQPDARMSEEARMEETRDTFFALTDLDLKQLSGSEVRLLLELLPRALVYLHAEYDMAKIYEMEADGQAFVDN